MKRGVKTVVGIALLASLAAALWGSPEHQRTLSALLRNVNHAVWAGVGAERLLRH